MNLFTPQETAERICASGQMKGNLSLLKTSLLGIAAGAFIACAAFAATIVSTGWPTEWAGSGLCKVVMGGVFSLGLMLTVLTGAELFTGNNMFLIVSAMEKKTSWGLLLKNWIIVYFTNFLGALLLLAIVIGSGFLVDSSGTITAAGTRALAIGEAKAGLTFLEAFCRGIGCNWLVCLAVWIASSAHDIVGKIFGCFFPIMVFVLVGFEHCIANMYFIPAAMLMPGSTITGSAFLFNNLIPATLGNIVGGGIFVGMLFWGAYLLPKAKK